ncbi:MAG: Veg family protein [Bacilli bacterium]|nr:Veg family protein [Bacilli bacterium]
MTIDKVKKIVLENKNKKKKFIYKGTRNQIDEFIGTINETYPVIFTIKLEDNSIKSYSYSDILIGNLKIID